MTTLSPLARGFAAALRHRRLILVVWLAPLVPALLLTLLAGAAMRQLDVRPFAGRILDGDWLGSWIALRAPAWDPLEPILGFGVMTAMVVMVVVQVLLSAGIAEVVLEERRLRPFVTGVRRSAGRFLRAAGWFLIVTGVCLIPAATVAGVLFDAAESSADGRLDLVGIAAFVAVFLVCWTPLAMAYDQSRLAAVAHDQGSMGLGLLRGLKLVLFYPRGFLVLALASAVLPGVLHLAAAWLRSLVVPGTTAALILLLLAQQLVMLMRAAIKVGLWGAHATWYRRLGSPPLSRRWRQPAVAPDPLAVTTAADPA